MSTETIPYEKMSNADLVDQLLQYVDTITEASNDGNGKSQIDLLLPVVADAGVYLDSDETFYVFEMEEDIEVGSGWEPESYQAFTNLGTNELGKALTRQIQNASHKQLVRYMRWADNMIART